MKRSSVFKCALLFSLGAAQAVQASEGELSGTYTVPRGSYMDEPVKLVAPSVHWEPSADGTIELEYELPYEIVGTKAGTIKLHSVSALQPLRLRGEMGDGFCRRIQDQMSCTISYKKNAEGIFPIDTEAGLAHMQELQLDEAAIASIKGAQETLMHEAVGILVFRLP